MEPADLDLTLDSLLRKVFRRWPLTCAALLNLGLGKGEKAGQNTMQLRGKESKNLKDFFCFPVVLGNNFFGGVVLSSGIPSPKT